MSTVAIGVLIVLATLIIVAFVRRASQMSRLISYGNKLSNTMAKISTSIEMFRKNIPEHRLAKGANEYDLYYYIGYITAVAETMVTFDGIKLNGPDNVMLAPVQIEASRLFGESENGGYVEGKALLSQILRYRSAEVGHHEGEIDGRYAANPRNPGPYFEHLRIYFGITI